MGRWAQSGVPPPSLVSGGCHLGLGKHHLAMPLTHYAWNTQPYCEILTVMPAARRSVLTEPLRKDFQAQRPGLYITAAATATTATATATTASITSIFP